jgi:hypothetical protein
MYIIISGSIIQLNSAMIQCRKCKVAPTIYLILLSSFIDFGIHLVTTLTRVTRRKMFCRYSLKVIVTYSKVSTNMNACKRSLRKLFYIYNTMWISKVSQNVFQH